MVVGHWWVVVVIVIDAAVVIVGRRRHCRRRHCWLSVSLLWFGCWWWCLVEVGVVGVSRGVCMRVADAAVVGVVCLWQWQLLRVWLRLVLSVGAIVGAAWIGCVGRSLQGVVS